MRVGDVRPPQDVGVDAEVVEQLAAGFAREAFLADAAFVHCHEPLRFAPTGGRVVEVLNEPHVVGLVLFRRAVVDEVDAAGGGGEPGEDRLGRAAAEGFRAAPRLAVVAGLRGGDRFVVRPCVPDRPVGSDRDVGEVVVEVG